MIKFEIGPLKDFIIDFGNAIFDAKNVAEKALFQLEDDLPKLKAELERELERQLGLLRYIHSSDAWQKQKEKILSGDAKHEGFERIKGQGKMPVVSSENWKATGTMEQVLLHKIESTKMQVARREDGFDVTIPLDLSNFVDSDDPQYRGMPYPLAVDEKVRERTGGDMGLFEFHDENRRYIFELFIADLDKYINRIFGSGGQ